VEAEATQRAREPVVCPPRPSWTVTVSRQLLHVPDGMDEGTKEAELEVAFVQVPEQRKPMNRRGNRHRHPLRGRRQRWTALCPGD